MNVYPFRYHFELREVEKINSRQFHIYHDIEPLVSLTHFQLPIKSEAAHRLIERRLPLKIQFE
jgi:hypothetical protein